MWNEFMEWDNGDDPITFYDDDDFDRLEQGRDPQWEDSQPIHNIEALGLFILCAGFGFLGSLTGTAISRYIEKRKEKHESKETHATTERIRANIQDHKQEVTETLQSNGNSRKDS